MNRFCSQVSMHIMAAGSLLLIKLITIRYKIEKEASGLYNLVVGWLNVDKSGWEG